jgi:SagB-type dehydrogenase family enzyme
MNRKELFDRLSPLYRSYHKNQFGFVEPERLDLSETSNQGPRTESKTYQRRKEIAPESEQEGPYDDAILDALWSRSSFDDSTISRPVSKSELFRILTCSYGITDETGTRPIASAGQKYPLEIYPLVIDSHDIDAGLYHYNPERSVLERPADVDYITKEFGPLDTFVTENWQHLSDDHGVSVMLVVTGIPPRSTEKYGERGYMFTLIETGALIQSLQLAAAAQGVGSRPYAGFNFKTVSELLGLHEYSEEWVLTSIALAGTQD